MLATGGSWFSSVCVVWVVVDWSLGVLAGDRSYEMAAGYVLPVLLVVAPGLVAANLVLAQTFVGLPRWARITSLAVALLVALVAVAAFMLP